MSIIDWMTSCNPVMTCSVELPRKHASESEIHWKMDKYLEQMSSQSGKNDADLLNSFKNGHDIVPYNITLYHAISYYDIRLKTVSY